ncbi:uncharacterized protein Smp_202870 [Schistosoma mansoni]|uniref:uncharacterized protein n=1 Tax=Schistosoma mansoni TaxID=6183 RepID=UPI00022DC78C|nr:uncharacterized protein Smp_202870 [Schistosoma mansoni]|eukprot:XP_018652658.1 uncharacterized protein Smp_202870 [Schistosoma mansoni]
MWCLGWLQALLLCPKSSNEYGFPFWPKEGERPVGAEIKCDSFAVSYPWSRVVCECSPKWVVNSIQG